PRITAHHNSPAPATTPLCLHDALPIFLQEPRLVVARARHGAVERQHQRPRPGGLGPPDVLTHHATVLPRRQLGVEASGQVLGRADRKSTRLNSSHVKISYAVFCLKKKK